MYDNFWALPLFSISQERHELDFYHDEDALFPPAASEMLNVNVDFSLNRRCIMSALSKFTGASKTKPVWTPDQLIVRPEIIDWVIRRTDSLLTVCALQVQRLLLVHRCDEKTFNSIVELGTVTALSSLELMLFVLQACC